MKLARTFSLIAREYWLWLTLDRIAIVANFITTAKTPWLNMRHTIFGKVISGYDVVQKIENAVTNASDRPIEEQKITKAYLKKQ
jgi:hypothetical protein